MRDGDLGLILLGIVPVLLVLPILWWYRRRSRDEIFEGITPGELPGVGHQVRRVRVGGGFRGQTEYAGPVTVRFTPPDGVTPGLAGTVIDGSADRQDLSATLIDLAVRGYFQIHPLSPDGTLPAAAPAQPGSTPPPPPTGDAKRAKAAQGRDYLLTMPDPLPSVAQLRPFERTLIDPLYAAGSQVHLRQLGPGFAQAMREARVGLYREVVDRGWYLEHPRIEKRRLGCLMTPVLVIAAALMALGVWQLRARGEATLVGFTFPIGILLAAYLLFRGARRRSARTAEGSAVRIQTMNFREYLTKAEAAQIRFEEASDLFSRYLPYAIVFGVAERWATVFGEVAARAHAAGWADASFDLDWFDIAALADLADGLSSGGLALLDGLDGLDALGSLGDIGDLAGNLGDALGGVANGVGDFASSAADLIGGGDGCGDGCDLDLGGCDGCDLP